jgi:hypothetical protein
LQADHPRFGAGEFREARPPAVAVIRFLFFHLARIQQLPAVEAAELVATYRSLGLGVQRRQMLQIKYQSTR